MRRIHLSLVVRVALRRKAVPAKQPLEGCGELVDAVAEWLVGPEAVLLLQPAELATRCGHTHHILHTRMIATEPQFISKAGLTGYMHLRVGQGYSHNRACATPCES